MKTKNSLIQRAGNLAKKLVTAIVSGIPGKKLVFKPQATTVVQNKKNKFRPEGEKHYHRPTAKPAVEKQTLLKEKKKARVVHQ